jgi:spermidine synthase
MAEMSGQSFVELVPDPDRPSGWSVLVDGFPQSHVDLCDPRYLEFEYIRRLGHVIDLAAPAGTPLRVLHLGGGGLTLARYVAVTRPESPQLAVDCDAALIDVVRRRLPLEHRERRADGLGRPDGQRRTTRLGAQERRGRRGRIRVRLGDARAVLETVRHHSFDLVLADLFAGGQTPAHVTTAEFTGAALGALAESGIFAANIGDGPPLAHARARAATVRSVFPRACLIADPGVLRGRRFGNLVLVASRRDLPVADLARRTAADPFPGRVITGEELDRFAAGARPITDESAEPSPAPPPDLFPSHRPGAKGETGGKSRRTA